jgi:hypothetical protein
MIYSSWYTHLDRTSPGTAPGLVSIIGGAATALITGIG